MTSHLFAACYEAVGHQAHRPGLSPVLRDQSSLALPAVWLPILCVPGQGTRCIRGVRHCKAGVPYLPWRAVTALQRLWRTWAAAKRWLSPEAQLVLHRQAAGQQVDRTRARLRQVALRQSNDHLLPTQSDLDFGRWGADVTVSLQDTLPRASEEAGGRQTDPCVDGRDM